MEYGDAVRVPIVYLYKYLMVYLFINQVSQYQKYHKFNHPRKTVRMVVLCLDFTLLRKMGNAEHNI